MNKESFSKAMEDIILRFDSHKSGLPKITFPVASREDFDWLMIQAKEAMSSETSPKNIHSIYIWDENHIEVTFNYIYKDMNVYMSIIPYDVFMAPLCESNCKCEDFGKYTYKTW